jgi:hypothetical protein
MTLSLVPPISAVAAIAVIALTSSQSLPEALADELAATPEPYRWAMYRLGWGSLDGTTWWSEVMDIIG